MNFERQLRWLQRRLERFYGLERAPNVEDFLRLGAANTREQLIVRQSCEGVYLAVVFPQDKLPQQPLQPSDDWAQLIEAVSHFLFLAERSRIELPTTQLELELQAEIDKFVLLAAGNQVSERNWPELHRWLYDDVRYLHAPETELGARYRLANYLAARFVHRLMRRSKPVDWQPRLRAFYRAGQTEKIHLALAA